MSIETDFSDASKVLILISKAQDAEQVERGRVKEAKLFISERSGMWDEDSWNKMDGRFRGSFDMCTPIIDGIAGEIDQADFSLRVSPSGGRASMDTAKTLDGIVRNIRNISNAEDIFNKAARSNVVGGFDVWEVVQDYIEGDSFDQDLLIRKVPNAVDSVWFDTASVEQDRSDARWGVKLVSVLLEDYKSRWPDGSGLSIGRDSTHRNDDRSKTTKDIVTVGQLYYKKPMTIEIVRMTDGTVYRVDDLEKVQDELAAQNPPITIEVDEKGEEKRRTRKSWRVHSRMLDGGNWLAEEEETVFDYIPLVPIYGNFDIIDNRCVYFGKLENLYDSQRVYNYAASRDIEDGALSPSPATWMTDKQAEGNDYSRMNTDRSPVRIYNPDDNANIPPPFQMGGPQPSTGLQTTMANMQQMVNTSSNTFNAQQGNASSTQSGVAGLQQIEQGNVGNIKWFKALEVAICYTGKILINAIPRVYDGTRQARILSEDGTSTITDINKTVFDQQTRTNIVLNDLSVGEYDVVCEMGPAFNSAQKEAARSFEVLAGIDPALAQRGMDIWLKNKKEPGMDLMAERVRGDLFSAGQIPESQLTDDEKQQLAEAQAQAAQQPPQPDPLLLAAQAEQLKGQAAMTKAQTDQQVAQGEQQLKLADLQLRQQGQQLDVAKFQREKDDKFNVDAAKITQGQQKIDQDGEKMLIDARQNQRKIELDAQAQALQAQADNFKMFQAAQEAQQKQLNDAIANLKTLREAMGVDAIVGPTNTEAYINQAEQVTELQEESEGELTTIEVIEAPEEPENDDNGEDADEDNGDESP